MMAYLVLALAIAVMAIEGMLNLNPDYITPVLCITLGFKRTGKWRFGWIKWGRAADQSLFYNGILCIRLMLPFFVGIGIRWAGSNPAAREFMHAAVGWKLNGELTAELRVQSDESSSAGATSPNYGQAWGWQEGPK